MMERFKEIRELGRGGFGTMDACSGLTAAHKAHVFHRDIKPDNILVRDADGVAILIDFGISAIMRTTAAANKGGATPYMAPESLAGNATFWGAHLIALGDAIRAGHTDFKPLRK